MTRTSIGGYAWTAFLRDGTYIHEFPENSDEHISISTLADADVQTIVLNPLTDYHRTIVYHIAEDEQWSKVWVRTFTILDDGTSEEQYTIDRLSLQSPRPVYTHIYPDGSIVISSMIES